jgi:uncharacterized protein YprB with RNaseH-like and TPR domain
MDQEAFRQKYPLRTASEITTKMTNDDAEGTLGREGELPDFVGYFDIETTHLDPKRGYILCASIAGDDLSVETWRIDEFNNKEGVMVARMKKFIESNFDIAVTWNGKYFDLPWLNHRLRIHNKAPYEGRHLDAMYMVPRNAPSRSLDKVSRSLGLQDENEDGINKTPYDEAIWSRAMAGDKDSLDYIVTHNRKDVLLLGRTFRAMRDR